MSKLLNQEPPRSQHEEAEAQLHMRLLQQTDAKLAGLAARLDSFQADLHDLSRPRTGWFMPACLFLLLGAAGGYWYSAPKASLSALPPPLLAEPAQIQPVVHPVDVPTPAPDRRPAVPPPPVIAPAALMPPATTSAPRAVRESARVPASFELTMPEPAPAPTAAAVKAPAAPAAAAPPAPDPAVPASPPPSTPTPSDGRIRI